MDDSWFRDAYESDDCLGFVLLSPDLIQTNKMLLCCTNPRCPFFIEQIILLFLVIS